MNITAVNTIKLHYPLAKPMRTRYINLESAYGLLVIIATDQGVSGQGLIRVGALPDLKIIDTILHEKFIPFIIGKYINSPEKIWEVLWLSSRNHLQSSFARYALAGIDIALWDIHAQLSHQSLHNMLNIHAEYVTPYGNGAWLVDSNEEMVSSISEYLAHGCKHFKMRVGCDTDRKRIQFLRDTFGDELILAADANQYFDFTAAVEMSKMLADYNICWFEEPLFSNSITDLARLAELSPVPIATGENMNSHWQFQDACRLKIAKIYQPDVIYHGGITEFKKTAEIINNEEMTLGAHLFHELSLSIAGLCSKHYVEHIYFFPDDFFTHDFSIKDGKIALPTIPGHGVTVSNDAIKKYRFNY